MGQNLPLVIDDTTGFVWFTDAEKLELYLKVLDGTAINGHFWVFYGALSNWQYTVTVTDTVTSMQAVYTNPLGTFASSVDVRAFPEPARSAPPPTSRAAPLATARGPLTCVPDSTTLCLDSGRFQVEVDWRDFVGNTGDGAAIPVTDLSGLFWFFAANNIDLAVKIFDGGDGNFWIFFGSTTEVEYTLTVTDVCTDTVRQYLNPLGTLTSGGDFMAFPVTPNCNAEIFSDSFESGDTTAW